MREIQISGCTEGKGSISKPLQIPPGSLKESARASRLPQLPWDQGNAGWDSRV